MLDGDQAPPPVKGSTPSFWPMSIVAKRLDGLKMPLSMEVGFGLGPDDFVFDGDPASPPPRIKGTAPHPIFGPCLLWPKSRMDQDAT